METYFIRCLILLTLLVEVHSETKEVFRGGAVLLFANVTADSPDNKVHLYINGAKDNTLIASWKFEKAGILITFSKQTYRNIVMDVDRNILIYKVDENYMGKYCLLNSSRPAIELIVLGNSQIKSESPSQNTALWIVCIALVALLIFASVVIIYVTRTKKWGMRIRTCSQRRERKPVDSREVRLPLVNETPRDDQKHGIESLEALDKVNETPRDDQKHGIESLEALDKVVALHNDEKDDQKYSEVIKKLDALERGNETLRDDLKRGIERLEALDKELQEVKRRCTKRELGPETNEIKKHKREQINRRNALAEPSNAEVTSKYSLFNQQDTRQYIDSYMITSNNLKRKSVNSLQSINDRHEQCTISSRNNCYTELDN